VVARELRGDRARNMHAHTADLLVTRARIQTFDDADTQAEAMLVRAGRIAWVGTMAALPDVGDAIRVDAGGRTIVPGFVEPHMHLAAIAALAAFEDVGPFRYATVAGALAELASLAARTPPGEWIVGRQFDPSLQEGPGTLTADMLDTVSAVHPIFVYNASLHFAYCNRRALELAGIDATTRDPEGSSFGRDARGQPNGVLQGGAAMAAVARMNPRLRDTDLAEACLGVFEAAAQVGFTTICDQGVGALQGARELELLGAIRATNRMACRLRYSLMNTSAAHWESAGVQFGDGDAWCRASAWKIVSDGSNQGLSGLQREPYLDGGQLGVPYIGAADLTNAIARRLREGWPVNVHANGDAAIDRVLDAFDAARRAGLDPAALRCRIEHCSILHDEQIQRMKALGISPSFLIGHVHWWGKAFRDRIFGAEKAVLLDRTASCAAAGIRWTLHSDEPVTPMGPLRCIENAVTRRMWRTDDEVLAPDECVDVTAALRAMTRDAAWQCHSDHEIGTLEVGKFADFVVLGADPRQVAADEIGSIAVEETWVEGRCVYRAG
jgi:predicted amidohydrolase YtcJ